jgi:hypothetical protein
MEGTLDVFLRVAGGDFLEVVVGYKVIVSPVNDKAGSIRSDLGSSITFSVSTLLFFLVEFLMPHLMQVL